MRYVNIPLCLLMLVFVAVQHDDPDGPVWMAIYLVPAAWTALAAFDPALVARRGPHLLLLACIAAGIAGAVRYWPSTPRWWARDVWYEAETAREGMGMMIIVIVLGVVWTTARLARMRNARQ